MPRTPEQSAALVKSLAERLEALPAISSLSTAKESEPWILAHSLIDIADASEAYLDRLPALLDSNLQGEDLVQLLIELSNDLQHVLYHLEDPRFLRELFAPLREDWEQQRAR